jgi:hypothetical protein
MVKWRRSGAPAALYPMIMGMLAIRPCAAASLGCMGLMRTETIYAKPRVGGGRPFFSFENCRSERKRYCKVAPVDDHLLYLLGVTADTDPGCFDGIGRSVAHASERVSSDVAAAHLLGKEGTKL